MANPALMSDDDLMAAVRAAETAALDPTTVLDALEAVTPGNLRALTVRNRPFLWAGLIAAGIKGTENRSRRTHYRGPVLIHASASHKPVTDLYGPDGEPFEVSRPLMACGRILALAVIDGCHWGDDCCAPWGEPGQWHWTLSGVRALPRPIPAKGALGFWRPGPEALAETLRQLREAPDA